MKLETVQEEAILYKTAWLNYLKRTGHTQEDITRFVDAARKALEQQKD